MVKKIKGTFPGAQGKLTSFDFTYDSEISSSPVMIFCHGFKGFKDWGGFNYVAEQFAHRGIAVFKINFSHNGTRIDDQENFSDLDSFSKNTFQMEMDDVKAAEEFIDHDLRQLLPEWQGSSLYLLGHSKGGVSCLLHAAHYVSKAEKIVTWGTPFNFYRAWSAKFMKEWREQGVQYVLNGRTKQHMPLSVSLLDDFEKHKDLYDMAKALPKVQQAVYIFQGLLDESVHADNAQDIAAHCRASKTFMIPNANHTFGMTHPFDSAHIPEVLQEVITKTADSLLNPTV